MKSSRPLQNRSKSRHARASSSVRTHRWWRWVCVLLVPVVIYLSMSIYEYWQVQQELDRVREQERQLLQQQEQLKQEEARYQDPQQIEKEAREQLGLVKEDEVPYIR